VPGGRRQAATNGRRRTRLGPVAAVVTLVGVFCTGLGLGQATGAIMLPPWLFRGEAAPPREFPVLESSRPIRIAIPSIGVRAPVREVGLAADGSIGVPELGHRNEAAWYRDGPTPGQFGPAVIVGHVDTRTGPAVFQGLDALRPGARIEVTRRDRRVAVFTVNSVETFSKAKLPANRVYGDFTRPGLRLITCGGRWVGGELGYADNVVVFASLVRAYRA
jgi:hypothetical protein